MQMKNQEKDAGCIEMGKIETLYLEIINISLIKQKNSLSNRRLSLTRVLQSKNKSISTEI